ncbi:hypothetical protein DPMN_126920 [Dreissena polymorpha]|uniref:Uncharacterized protein n=1 Tax=Dreissena polymorpha TaxID=45954 RepID=A0A9D4H0A6_DREPO|nr:hypothetical protein DPMN_126920 [Dreissena polymorpha]
MPITTSQLTIGRECRKRAQIFGKENSCLIRGVIGVWFNPLMVCAHSTEHPHQAKKPKQVKRKRADKSHTPMKRLVLGTNQSQ